ncbi:CoA-binding protein [Alkalihalobacillus sp. AL-G]|uniref:CoA-binding protein n=1 Tax=Alkalihalobacillus sp. AL-G TaxID=2926399 RepID=UPI00272CFDA7|nr:CoA-binding protein [Alkalihalobacillus sp. AL-G]WLD91747.1 CoA-binding protein [Alkalihalobacillus sp. AL-G]
MAYQNPDKSTIKEILQTKKRIAVVGLSDRPERTSYQVSQYMQNNGYEIIPVNPSVSEVLGEKAYKSLQDIDGKIDIVNVFRRSEHLPEVAKETRKVGADVFWAQLGLKNDEAAEILQDSDTTVVMDRCIKVDHASM